MFRSSCIGHLQRVKLLPRRGEKWKPYEVRQLMPLLLRLRQRHRYLKPCAWNGYINATIITRVPADQIKQSKSTAKNTVLLRNSVHYKITIQFVLYQTARRATTKKFAKIENEFRSLPYESPFLEWKSVLNLLPSPIFHMLMLTGAKGVMEWCSARSTTTVRLLHKTRTQYHGVGKVNGDNTKRLLVQCKQLHMEVLPLRAIKLKFLSKHPVWKFLSRIDFYLVIFIVVEKMLPLCSLSTPINVLLFITVCIE